MSKTSAVYGYEKGEFHLPKSVFTRIRKAVRAEYAKRRRDSYETAVEVYEKIVAVKGRGVDRRDLFEKFSYKQVNLSLDEITRITGTSDPSEWPAGIQGKKLVSIDPHGWIYDSIFTRPAKGEQLTLNSNRPRKPRKHDFDTASRLDFFSLFSGDVWIAFTASSCRVDWRCEQSNDMKGTILRSHCRSDSIVKTFFEGVEDTKRWGSNGGRIVARDGEYVLCEYGKALSSKTP